MNLSAVELKPRSVEELARHVHTIPDFPKPGIQFKDITPLLREPEAFQELIERMAHDIKQSGATVVMGLESRGFIFGIAAAQHLGLPFVPARKAGKLPGEKVAIVDDLLATGGSACRYGRTLRGEK